MISLKGSVLNIKGLGSMRLELCLLCALLWRNYCLNSYL